MPDLLQRLHDANPIPHCPPPSIDDVWRKLDAPVQPEAAPTPRRRLAHSARLLPAFAGVGVTLAVLVFALVTLRSAPNTDRGGAAQDAAWHYRSNGPSLSAMWAHFAVLRRPATQADHAAEKNFIRPIFVRSAGRDNGKPVYFVVNADRRHGQDGPIFGYHLGVYDAQGGIEYAGGDYGIFPELDETITPGPPPGLLGVAPDGVRRVRWHFECLAGSAGTGCVLPHHSQNISLPVHNNIVTLALPRLNPGMSWADAVSVTWYRSDGTTTTFTNQETAVPWAGAPAAPVIPASHLSYASGNGHPAGRSLAHWRSLYSTLRRPPTQADRRAAAANVDMFEKMASRYTRLLLDADGTRVLVALSLVNPSAPTADQRYIAQVGNTRPSSLVEPLRPGVAVPKPVPSATGSTLLDYSVVPDDVTKVRWHLSCSPGCPSHRTLTLTPHHNIVDATLPNPSGSLVVTRAEWYVRGRSTPLRAPAP